MDTALAKYTIPPDAVVITALQRDELHAAITQGRPVSIVAGVPVIGTAPPPPAPTAAQQAADALATGLTITSSTIPLSAVTFPTDINSRGKYNSVQTHINTNGTFPGGATSGPIKDASGSVDPFHIVTTAQYTAIATAICAFVSACDLVIDGYSGATVPSTSVTIA